ncbi:MAG: hypothetical protein M1818_004191 [Claussenomyces sp. TS43310]|nr:MAG: hypothetical protein M1818_004191 [Claussenomyces sp. TS43310]
MADGDAKAKAEKLAAAKKRASRVEQLKKQKAKKAGGKAEEPAAPAVTESVKSEEQPADDAGQGAEDVAETQSPADDGAETPEAATAGEPPADSATARARQPSVSVQSKMRSSSFRQGANAGPLSPSPGFNPEEAGSAPEIYRKQAAKIDELERENKRLARAAGDAEKRWRKAEDELEDLREGEGSRPASVVQAGGSASEVEKLKTEIAALQRQNTQLQAQSSRSSRHGTTPSVSHLPIQPEDLSAQLASKSSTIESMEIEISNLRAQLARTATGSSAEKEQIAALEEKVSRTQRSLDTSQQELQDLKKNLERTTEKAVKEGSERTSAETKLRTLTREAAEAKAEAQGLQKKVEGLEKKVTTLTTLHEEHDARSQALRKERERADKEAADLRNKLASLENDNLRLREERERAKKREAEGADDEGVDELENEERQRLEQKVRGLESEIFELRRGVWKDRRKEIDGDDSSGLNSPGAKFTDVDLGGMSPTHRRSVGHGTTKALGELFTNSFNAFTGQHTGAEPLLEDEDIDFDEEAFRLAQQEEAKKRIERVKDIKRGLNDWKGWKLDLVETRRGGGEGAGEIFEV